MNDQKKMDLAVDFTVKEHERIRQHKATNVFVYPEVEDYDAVGLKIQYEDGSREMLLLDPLNMAELGTLLASRAPQEEVVPQVEEKWITLDTMKSLV